MSDICGPTLPVPLARYDRETSSWKTCEDTSLWDLPLLLVTLPAWGMTLGGVLFEQPTPGHLTGGRGFSSLPTPTHRDHKDHEIAAAKHRPDDTDTLSRALAHLLPTPVADHSRGIPSPTTDYQSLANAVTNLLPTPTVVDMGNNKTPQEWSDWKAAMKTRHQNGNGHGPSLAQEAIGVSTGLLSDDGNE